MGRSEADFILQKREKINMIILSIAKAVALFGIIACGMLDRPTVIHTPQNQEIDSRLHVHYEAFRKDCKLFREDCDDRLSNIVSMTVVDTFEIEEKVTKDTIGVCYPYVGAAYIEVKQDALDIGEHGLRGLVYHEIAHCAYYTNHVERKNTLMSAYIPEYIILRLEWDSLVRELFQEIGAQYED